MHADHPTRVLDILAIILSAFLASLLALGMDAYATVDASADRAPWISYEQIDSAPVDSLIEIRDGDTTEIALLGPPVYVAGNGPWRWFLSCSTGGNYAVHFATIPLEDVVRLEVYDQDAPSQGHRALMDRCLGRLSSIAQR